MKDLSLKYCLKYPIIATIINKYFDQTNPEYIQFLLDCSCLPLVITAHQIYGSYRLDVLFKVTRTICHSLHKSRLAVLGNKYISYNNYSS